MATGRYRVVINGFTVQAETWDDSLEGDGKHDEVYISAQVTAFRKNGSEVYRSAPRSPVLGDTWWQNGRVGAGSASDRGGLVTGDRFPGETPWIRTVPLTPQRNWPPFKVWEGDLTDDEDLVVITPGINEWDPGESASQAWLAWAADASGKLAPKIAGLLTGGLAQAVFTGAELGLGVVASMDRAGVLGRSHDRPIGMTAAGGNSFEFVPQLIVLDRARAEKIIESEPAGLGHGVLALAYQDDPYLRGHYILYVQVERVGPVVTGGGWSHWEPHAAWCRNGVSAASWSANRLDVFTVGIDDALYHKWWDGAQWHGFERLGGTYVGATAAVSRAPDRLDVFGINAADRAVHHRTWDGTGWADPVSLGGICGYGVAVASRSPDVLDVFTVGTDSALYHQWWDGHSWSGWHSLGGNFHGAPAAVSWGPNRVDVFAVGQDHATHQRSWDGTDWSPWRSLGGWCQYGVAVTSRQADDLDLFTVGSDGGLYQKRWSHGAWGEWAAHGGTWVGAPAAASWSPGRLDVFVIGTNRLLYHRWNG